jgi:hypothetical protein
MAPFMRPAGSGTYQRPLSKSLWFAMKCRITARRNSLLHKSRRNTADNAVPGPQIERVHAAAGSSSKRYVKVVGTDHYHAGQPRLLRQSIDICHDRMKAGELLCNGTALPNEAP